MHKPTICIAAVALIISTVSRANATHKNWVLRNAGNECSLETPGNEYYSTDILWQPSGGSGTKWAHCPVTLANRWGSSGAGAYSIPTPVNDAVSMWAFAYVSVATAGTQVFCRMNARMTDGFLYWSGGTFSTATVGDKDLNLMNAVDDWGGTLQPAASQKVLSMDVSCQLPVGGRVHGYRVKNCQNGTYCNDGQTAGSDVDFTDGQVAPVQTSGIECVAEGTNGSLQRTEYGIRNAHTNFTGDDYIECPLAQPADDSYDHVRTVRYTRVYFDGGNVLPGCDNLTCPSCRVVSMDRNHQFSYSAWLSPESTGSPYVQLPGSFSAGADHVLNVECLVPPGKTIRGVTSEMTVTRISGGI
jgi:hypothetical protein